MTTNPRRRYFNELAADWDQLPAPTDAPARIRHFSERAGAPGSRRILDVGCGTGVLLSHILELYRKATCVVEFDFAEAMLRVNLTKSVGDPVRHVCADAQSMPFLDDCFDLILCFGVLPHLEEKPAAIREFLRIMRPGAPFCVGHLQGSSELNEFHRSLPGPVRVDFLPAVDGLAEILREQGAVEICAEENPDWYFVRALKARR